MLLVNLYTPHTFIAAAVVKILQGLDLPQCTAGFCWHGTCAVHCKQEPAPFADKSLSLQVTGAITYNGKGFDEFQAVHTSSYVDQNDLHQPLLTVKETMDFAARVQGVGHKAGEHDAAGSAMLFIQT